MAASTAAPWAVRRIFGAARPPVRPGAWPAECGPARHGRRVGRVLFRLRYASPRGRLGRSSSRTGSPASPRWRAGPAPYPPVPSIATPADRSAACPALPAWTCVPPHQMGRSRSRSGAEDGGTVMRHEAATSGKAPDRANVSGRAVSAATGGQVPSKARCQSGHGSHLPALAISPSPVNRPEQARSQYTSRRVPVATRQPAGSPDEVLVTVTLRRLSRSRCGRLAGHSRALTV